MKKKKIQPSPLGQKILDYVAENETNLTALSLEAGLSSGSVRQIVIHPERRPTLETCLRLAMTMNIPSQEILNLAGLETEMVKGEHDPDKAQIINIYNQLPTPKIKRLFSNMAKYFSEAVEDRTTD